MYMAKKNSFLHIVWVIYSLESKSNSHLHNSAVLLHVSWILHLKRTTFEANGSSTFMLDCLKKEFSSNIMSPVTSICKYFQTN